MLKKIALIVAFDVSYKTISGSEGTWRFHGKLYPSGTLHIFDPAFKSADCETKNYFTGKLAKTLTNKGNWYFHLETLVGEFANIAIKECFFPFEDIHFQYNDPYIPEIECLVKMDEGVYERPISIKADYKGKWMTVDTAKKHLTIDAHHRRCLNRDE